MFHLGQDAQLGRRGPVRNRAAGAGNPFRTLPHSAQGGDADG